MGTGKVIGKATDGPISRYVNRRISMRITKAIIHYNLPLTPNQVSVISFLLSIIAAALILLGQYLWGGILVQISSIIDGADGELARALGKASRLGGLLDSIFDRLADISIIAAIAYEVASIELAHPTIVLLVSLAALSGDIMVSYLHARGEASLGKHPALIGAVPQFASRDVRLFVIFIGLVLGKLLETLVVLAIITYLYVIAKT
ncbi:MAG: CDP-alcohol phosphatidyltransferase family protein, partial [Pyrodictiaceae archaeon]